MATLQKILAAKSRLPSPEERRRLRESAGLSIRAFANALDISPSTLARWEGGERHPIGPHLFVYVDGLQALARAEKRDATS